MSIRWLTVEMVDAVHEMQIAQFGGWSGTRDDGLVDSALARPKNLAAHGEPRIAELAAAYAFGIARHHPFIDGNKRTAFMAAYVFLGLNGLRLEAPEEEAVIVFRDLAAGDLDEGELVRWIEDRSVPKDD
jgi:death-on-curing protein